MKTLTIRKGRKGILRFPNFINKDSYTVRVLVTESMMNIQDDCGTSSSGWSKCIGQAFVWHHWNSFRLVLRVHNKELYFGYYCYINKVSPQQNKSFKSNLSHPHTIVKAKPGDTILFKVRYTDKTYITIINESDKDPYARWSNIVEETLPLPSGVFWPAWETNPNIKCKAKENIHFKFS